MSKSPARDDKSDKAGKAGNTSKNNEADNDDTPLLEWIFGGIGLVVFVGALAVSVLNGLVDAKPPSITTHVGSAERVGDRFRVEFEAFNAGDQTASLVELVATLSEGGTLVESHTVQVDFLPPHSSRRAGVFLDHNPEGRQVQVAAVSYQHP